MTGLDSAALLMLNFIKIFNFGRIQTSQTGGQMYSDTSPYKVSECSLCRRKEQSDERERNAKGPQRDQDKEMEWQKTNMKNTIFMTSQIFC